MKSKYPSALAAFFCITYVNCAAAQMCPQWTAPQKIGEISAVDIHEASGLVASAKFPGRLYWINDSGDKPRVYITDLTGRLQGKFKFADKKLKDTESLAYGDCGGEKCLIVGDTGDNDAKRGNINLVFIKEAENFGKEAKPWLQLQVKFPDKPQDTEAITMLPDGDLLFVTKKKANVYVLPKSEFAAPDAAGVKVLVKRGELPLKNWLKDSDPRGQIVTDMAYDAKRGVIGLLTYQNAVEFSAAKLNDLANAGRWVAGVDYSIVALQPLMQQETMTYVDGRLVWSSEIPMGTAAPLNALGCGSAQ